MMAEKSRLHNLKWNNQKTGFSLTNKNSWYTFSLPYFSKDKKKAFICIQSLCPGLFGSGEVLLYQCKNNKWASQKVDSWLH
jgi:hypothetical protein